jgi:hypothetical protein
MGLCFLILRIILSRQSKVDGIRRRCHGSWLCAIQPAFNSRFSRLAGKSGSAQNVLAVRFKLIQPIFPFELSPFVSASLQTRVELE